MPPDPPTVDPAPPFLDELGRRLRRPLGRFSSARQHTDDLVSERFDQLEEVLAFATEGRPFDVASVEARLRAALGEGRRTQAAARRLGDLLDLFRRTGPDALREERARSIPPFRPRRAPPRPLWSRPSRYRSRRLSIEIGGPLEVRYVVAGAEPESDEETQPVCLLLHGHGSRIEEYDDLIEELATLGRSSVVLDLPGFGYSQRWPRGRGGLEDLIESVVRFIPAFEARHRRFRIETVAGGSLGGLLALRLAGRLDSRLEPLDLLAWSPACLWPRLGAVAALVEVWGRLPFTFRPTQWIQALTWYGHPPVRNLLTIAEVLRQRAELADRGYRRTYWRVAVEQLRYSLVRDEDLAVALRARRDRYAPSDEESGPGRVGIILPSADRVAILAQLANVRGWLEAIEVKAVLIRNTGHAIANERPARLARALLREADVRPGDASGGGRVIAARRPRAPSVGDIPVFAASLTNYGHDRRSSTGAVHVPETIEAIVALVHHAHETGLKLTIRGAGNCLHNQSLPDEAPGGPYPSQATILLDRGRLGGRPRLHVVGCRRTSAGQPDSPEERRAVLSAPAWCHWGDALESALAAGAWVPVISPSASGISLAGSLSADGVTRMSPIFGKESQAVLRMVAVLPQHGLVEVHRPGWRVDEPPFRTALGSEAAPLPPDLNDRVFDALVGGHGLVGVIVHLILEVLDVSTPNPPSRAPDPNLPYSRSAVGWTAPTPDAPSLPDRPRPGEIYVKTWVRSYLDWEDLAEILLLEHQEARLRVAEQGGYPRRIEPYVKSSFAMAWPGLGPHVERGVIVTNTFGRAPAGLDPRAWPFRPKQEDLEEVPRRRRGRPSPPAEVDRDGFERGVGVFRLWNEDTSFVGKLLALALLDVRGLGWIIPLGLDTLMRWSAWRTRRILSSEPSWAPPRHRLVRRAHISLPRGFYFFMDGHVRAQRLLRRNRVPTYPLQQSFALPIEPLGSTARSHRLVTFLRIARDRSRSMKVPVSIAELKTQPPSATYLASGGRYERGSWRREDENAGGFLLTLSIERGDVDTAAKTGYLRALAADCVALGGRVHLAKNVLADESVLRAAYGADLEAFEEVREAVDPKKVLTSAFDARILPD